MKKLVCLLLFTVLTFSLAACGNTSSVEDETEIYELTPLGVILDRSSNEFLSADTITEYEITVICEENDFIISIYDIVEIVELDEMDEVADSNVNEYLYLSTIPSEIDEPDEKLDQIYEKKPDILLHVLSGSTISESIERLGGSASDPASLDGKGILAVSYEQGDLYNYTTSDSAKCVAGICNLDFIDPDTGDVSHFKTFSSLDTHSCTLSTRGLSSNTADALRSFSPDFTKMAASLTMEDGATHIGWIDENGDFTDVSAMITETSDFGALTKHDAPTFVNGYLYFTDHTDSYSSKRVPIDNISASAVETMIDHAVWRGIETPRADGSVVDSTNIYEYYDASLSHAAPQGIFTDWITDKECIGVENGMLYRYILNDDQSDLFFSNWYSDCIALVPRVNGRHNWCGVVSPEKDRVAFLSRLESGTDSTAHLFITSVSGNDEPVEIYTDYQFPSDFSIQNSYKYRVSLVDWR